MVSATTASVLRDCQARSVLMGSLSVYYCLGIDLSVLQQASLSEPTPRVWTKWVPESWRITG